MTSQVHYQSDASGCRPSHAFKETEVGRVWDDFMADFTTRVLDWPDRYTVEYNGKRCYFATFEIRTSGGQVAYTFRPTVVVSMTANRVITSYPTTNEDCSRQAAWAF